MHADASDDAPADPDGTAFGRRTPVTCVAESPMCESQPVANGVGRAATRAGGDDTGGDLRSGGDQPRRPDAQLSSSN